MPFDVLDPEKRKKDNEKLCTVVFDVLWINESSLGWIGDI
jgi:hypothetical protein